MKEFICLFKVTDDISLKVVNGSHTEPSDRRKTGMNLSIELETKKTLPPYYSDVVKRNILQEEIKDTDAGFFYEKWKDRRYKEMYLNVSSDLESDLKHLKWIYPYYESNENEYPTVMGARCGKVTEKPVDARPEDIYILENLDRVVTGNNNRAFFGLFSKDDCVGLAINLEDVLRLANSHINEYDDLDIRLHISSLGRDNDDWKVYSVVKDKDGISDDFVEDYMANCEMDMTENIAVSKSTKHGFDR